MIDNAPRWVEDEMVKKYGTRPLAAFFRSFKGHMVILFIALVLITTISQVFYKSSITTMHELLLQSIDTAEVIHAAENFHSASHVMFFISTNNNSISPSDIRKEYEAQKKIANSMLELLISSSVGTSQDKHSISDMTSKVESLANFFLDFSTLTGTVIFSEKSASPEQKTRIAVLFGKIFDTYIEILHEFHDTRLEDIKAKAFNMTRRIDFFFLLQLSLLITASILGIFFSNKALLQPYASVELQAFTDGLTGLWNRRYLDIVATSDTAELIRTASIFSVALLDIDKFKAFNDGYGHSAGDELLKGLASLLKKNVRESDVIIRYGGEEFLVIFPGTNKEKALLASEKMRRSIEDFAFRISNQHNASITASFGVASYPEDGANLNAIVKNADVRLYAAKTAGRNQVR